MTRTTRTRTALTLAALLLAAPSTAQTLPTDISLTVDPARASIDAFAVAMDTNRDSRISTVELDIAAQAIFASMDTDASGALTELEMTGWEHGMAQLAAFRGRTQAYDAALGVVFDLLDGDGSGTIDAGEHTRGMRAAGALADRDGDGAMTLGEFRDGFMVTTAIRQGLAD